MNKTNIVDYATVMSPKEISDVTILMNEFKSGNITYKQLIEMIKPLGFTIINANTLNTNVLIPNSEPDERLRERIILDELLPEDINSYILVNKEGTYILFKEDEQLASIMNNNGYQTVDDLLVPTDGEVVPSSHI